MAYSFTNTKGKTYYLHVKEVIMRSGLRQKIYYFIHEVRPGSLDHIPEGKRIVENQRTGLPMLVR